MGRLRSLTGVMVAAALFVVVLAPSALGKHGLPCNFKGVKDYPGDSAPAAAIAQWMGYYAVKAHLPAELPVMGALVESNLRNLPAGTSDADAAGYFGMRVSIWDTGAYAGFQTNPRVQLQWFIDRALIARDQRLAAGLAITEDHYGQWVADVLLPPEQDRYRYQLRLGDARTLLCL
jgi:hypothetical protein